MELHLVGIFRFIVCMLALVAGIVVILRAPSENHLLRLLAGVGCGLLIWFNEIMGSYLYLTIGATVEALIASFGLALVLTVGLAIVAMPIVLLLRLFIH